MTSKNRTTGVEIKSIIYTIQREGGCVHTVQRDPVDDVLACTCEGYIFRGKCWAMKMVQDGTAPKPRVRVRVRPAPARRPVVIVEERHMETFRLDVG